MEREIWLRAGMFATIMILVALVLITPSLLGQSRELASLPILIVAMTYDHKGLVVDLTSFSQPYLYDNITLELRQLNPDNSTVPYASATQNDTFSESLSVPANLTGWYIYAKLVDHVKNYFEINVTLRLRQDATGNPVMAFGFPDDEGSTTTVLRTPPDDFRWPVPRKGIVP